VSANHLFYQTFKVTPGETEGWLIYDLGNRQWNIPRLRELLEEIVHANTAFNNFEVEHDFQGIGRRRILLNGCRMHREAGKPETILLVIDDITQQKAGPRGA
ncbi:MAG: AAA family ATPase, partial [bacterium]|nr:AAA family ATPase [bacterium]